MNRRLEACLVSLMVAVIPAAMSGQQAGGSVPLQQGISVRMPLTHNAIAVPNADTQDALVVALTEAGGVYFRGERVQTSTLAERVRSILVTRNEKTLYIKADARVPYGSLVAVIDAVQKSGVEGLTLLTAQQAPADQANGVAPPTGLVMRVVNQRQ